MTVNPYLFFSGTCREAFTHYQQVFGGELFIQTMAEAPEGEAMPGSTPDTVMHAALPVGDTLLMGSDDPTSDGGPMKGVAVSYTADDVPGAEKAFGALSEGGEVTMPLGKTFWSPMFGMCTDRFGVPWMVGVNDPSQGS